MSVLMLVGIVLVIFGAFGLVYSGIVYTRGIKIAMISQSGKRVLYRPRRPRGLR